MKEFIKKMLDSDKLIWSGYILYVLMGSFLITKYASAVVNPLAL